MIIHCEKCRTKYDFDEGRLKKEGSKVRCSVCKHIFTVHPPEEVISEKTKPDAASLNEFEKTVSLDLERMLEKEHARVGGVSEDGAFEEEAAFGRDKGAEPEEGPLESLDDLFLGSAFDNDVEISTEEWGGEIRGKAGRDSIPKKRKGKSTVLRVFLLLLLLLIGGGIAVYYLAPDLIQNSLKIFTGEERGSRGDPGVSALSFEDVSGDFAQSKNAGQLFVISGMVKNEYSVGRKSILIKAAILDDKGKEVKVVKAYAGKSINESELSNISSAEIKKIMNTKRGIILKPGKTAPFTIVIGNLPKNISEFTVEAVSSLPDK